MNVYVYVRMYVCVYIYIYIVSGGGGGGGKIFRTRSDRACGPALQWVPALPRG